MRLRLVTVDLTTRLQWSIFTKISLQISLHSDCQRYYAVCLRRPVCPRSDRSPSIPDEDIWTQSTGLYVGGSQDAFATRHSAPVSSIINLFFFKSCDTLADSARRTSSSSLGELVLLALRPWFYIYRC